MVSADHAQQLLGARVVDADGDKVGTVNEVYLDDATSAPSWVTVATGWFGLSESFVPLNRAQISGDLIQVPFDKATIKDAPRFDGSKPLSPGDEEQLYRHYATSSGMPGARRTADTGSDSARYAETTSAASNPDPRPDPMGGTVERASGVEP